MSLVPPKSSRRFPTTHWALIEAMKDRDASDYMPAMNEFISGYWKPVFYFVLAKGKPLHEAENLTQEFFTRLLERKQKPNWIQKVDPKRGRFRNYLLKIVQRFLADQGPLRAPAQEQFERELVSIQTLIKDEDRSYEPASNESPERVFMKQWALAVLRRVRQRLRQLCESEAHAGWYKIFEAVHLRDPGSKRPTQEALAKRFSLSRDQVRYALEQTVTWFRQLLREEVSGQVPSKADIGSEIRELLDLLSSS